MINEKNNFLTVSWLSGLLSAEIFISTGEWGVQMPPLTTENSHLLRSGSQGATLVMPTQDDIKNIIRGETSSAPKHPPMQRMSVKPSTPGK